MDNLSDICNTWLANADLDISIKAGRGGCVVTLTFYVFGIRKKAVVECCKPTKFCVDQPSYELPMYTVFEADITRKSKSHLVDMIDVDFYDELPEKLWHINVSAGDARINLICEAINWEACDITEAEYEMFNEYK
ncbi:hypothetical protein Q4519_12485 [Motilimonas sp. 1_MG-2023]|uniref:hypothetical protein n=1 Tax=Motilimonas sp. 1_MG-2023 TaxID=3062672 RepID=UPI0026E2117D|nr:hypothetical protein [Motilimonas sp. 1_MG-2023]MDO6526501.1 hypothetical protein [Motilimonas sp. 1_MG-2023]